MIKISRRLFCAGAAATLFTPAIARAATTPLRIGWATAPVGPHAAGAQAFKDKLEELAPGRFQVELFPGGSLGGERELAESVQLGSLEMAVTGTSVLSNFAPDLAVVDVPFLFPDYASARHVMDGEIGEVLKEKLAEAGLAAYAFGEVGFRHVTNSRHPVTNAADMADLKIRTMENDVHIAAFRALGAKPTPMSWTEVLTGLQQGTVDGQENPLSIISSSKLWDSQKHLSLTYHAYTPVCFSLSPDFIAARADDEVELLREAAEAGKQANRAFVDKAEDEALAACKAGGMEVAENVDRESFIKALEPIGADLENKFGDLLARVRELA